MIKKLCIALLILTSSPTHKAHALDSQTIRNSIIIGSSLIAATIGLTYAYCTKQLLSGKIMMRDEPLWKNSLFLRFTEDSRLACRWAESRWPSGYDVMSARKHQKQEFCKAIDGASRGGFKAKYIGCQYYLLMFVQDLEQEMRTLDNIRGALLLAKRFLPGLRSYSQELLAKIDFYTERAVALKYAIVSRETYQQQVEDKFRRQSLNNADESKLLIHAKY